MAITYWPLPNMASHPSRGAWIEMVKETAYTFTEHVAPLTGCVD